MNKRAGRCRINYDFLGLLPSRTVPDEAARQVNRPAGAAERNKKVSWRDYSGWFSTQCDGGSRRRQRYGFFFLQTFVLLHL